MPPAAGRRRSPGVRRAGRRCGTTSRRPGGRGRRRAYKARVAANREAYVDRWGPRIFRERCSTRSTAERRLLERAVPRRDHRDQPRSRRSASVTGTPATSSATRWNASAGAVATSSARTTAGTSRTPSVEAVIVLLDAFDLRRLPRHLVTIAWIRNWPERWLGRPWFDDYDLVFGSSEPIVAMVRDAQREGRRRSSRSRPTPPASTSVEPRSRRSPATSCSSATTGASGATSSTPCRSSPTVGLDGPGPRPRLGSPCRSSTALDHGSLDYDDVPRAYASARIVVDDAAALDQGLRLGQLARVRRARQRARSWSATAIAGSTTCSGRRSRPGRTPASLVEVVDDPAATRAGDDPGAAPSAPTVLARHTYAIRAAAIRDALVAWATATRLRHPRSGSRAGTSAESWGDYHFARALQRALERSRPSDPAPLPARLGITPSAAREDVTAPPVRARGGPDAHRPGQPAVADQPPGPRQRRSCTNATTMSSSHPIRSPRGWPPLAEVAGHRRSTRRPTRSGSGRNRADLATSSCSSPTRARSGAGSWRTSPGPSARPGRLRPGWTPDLIDPRFVRGESIPNADLGRYYSSAAIVLNDHWDDMRAEGFISNRLYDALACGAFVISDHVEGIASRVRRRGRRPTAARPSSNRSSAGTWPIPRNGGGWPSAAARRPRAAHRRRARPDDRVDRRTDRRGAPRPHRG